VRCWIEADICQGEQSEEGEYKSVSCVGWLVGVGLGTLCEQALGCFSFRQYAAAERKCSNHEKRNRIISKAGNTSVW